MDFCNALVSQKRNEIIPEELDWFGGFVGEWNIDWTQDIGTEKEKRIKGEWIFSRVLNGCGIQDLFIVPSIEERKRLNQQNAEYGTTIRMFNPQTSEWEIYYTCIGEYTRLTAVKENDKIVLTEKSIGKMKWVFSDIKDNSFHWQNIMNIDGSWKVCCDCNATRRK